MQSEKDKEKIVDTMARMGAEIQLLQSAAVFTESEEDFHDDRPLNKIDCMFMKVGNDNIGIDVLPESERV
ncbi:MAG: hypothetical protein IKM88_00360 [Lachnospiraceae bacterium]|nr:hypothetical protein [Lachnospiraceae bacterium]MBR6848674.1 hypothetical protein [Lachnospiraceae bacterium]